MKMWPRAAAVLLLACSVIAQAEETSDSDAIPESSNGAPDRDRDREREREDGRRDDESVTYSGIGLSRVSTDFDNLKEAVNLDGVLGIRVPNLDWVSAEVRVAITIIPGENEGGSTIIGGDEGTCTIDDPPFPPGCTPASGGQQITQTGDDFQMQFIGAYLALRSPGRFYATGKVGYGYQITSVDEINERERSGTVYSAGLGWRYGKGQGGVELIYSRMLSEIDAIGFNVSYGFGGRRKSDD